MTILSDFIRRTHDSKRFELLLQHPATPWQATDVIITAYCITQLVERGGGKKKQQQKTKTHKYIRVPLHTSLIQITNPIRLKGIHPPMRGNSLTFVFSSILLLIVLYVKTSMMLCNLIKLSRLKKKRFYRTIQHNKCFLTAVSHVFVIAKKSSDEDWYWSSRIASHFYRWCLYSRCSWSVCSFIYLFLKQHCILQKHSLPVPI